MWKLVTYINVQCYTLAIYVYTLIILCNKELLSYHLEWMVPHISRVPNFVCLTFMLQAIAESINRWYLLLLIFMGYCWQEMTYLIEYSRPRPVNDNNLIQIINVWDINDPCNIPSHHLNQCWLIISKDFASWQFRRKYWRYLLKWLI